MPDYLVTCGPMRVTATAPDEASARTMAVLEFREQDPKWWTRGLVEVTQPAVNTCGCGVSYNLDEWRSLPLAGVQTFDDGQDPPRLELRNCPCGSTRGIEIDNEGEPWRAKPTRV